MSSLRHLVHGRVIREQVRGKGAVVYRTIWRMDSSLPEVGDPKNPTEKMDALGGPGVGYHKGGDKLHSGVPYSENASRKDDRWI